MIKNENKASIGVLLNKIEFRKYIQNGKGTCILSLSEEVTSIIKIELMKIESIQPVVVSLGVMKAIGSELFKNNPYLLDEYMNDITGNELNGNVIRALSIIKIMVTLMVPNLKFDSIYPNNINIYREDIKEIVTYKSNNNMEVK